MAKENTHSKFALDLLNDKRFPNSLKKIVEDNKLVYLYGSIYPDCFYYDKEYEQLSINIHNNTIKSNYIPINLLGKTPASTAFALGYLTHYVVDTNIHPVIDKICKDDDFCHLKIETNLDKRYSKNWRFFTFSNLIKLKNKIPYKEITALDPFKDIDLFRPLKKQTIIYQLIEFNWLYKILKLFTNNSKLGLFYSVEDDNLDFTKELEKGKNTYFEILEKILRSEDLEKAIPPTPLG
ncbi:MAG: zinc dependent phospholipase C family protein [Campylobacterales bacterium]|nr:zinc dependent phospholipase C family protein [Campylobacterales bacterium]